MKTAIRVIAIITLALMIMFAGVAGGVVLDSTVFTTVVPPSGMPADTADQFNLIGQAWHIIEQRYVDQSAVVSDQLAHGAIAGMVASLGDTGHSRFLSPDMVEEQHTLTQGAFQGIGAEVQMKDDHVVIVAPMDGSPAQKEGLLPGDIILRVDGQDISCGAKAADRPQRHPGDIGTMTKFLARMDV